MRTALPVKVITLLAYVALSTALVLMLADDDAHGAARNLPTLSAIH